MFATLLTAILFAAPAIQGVVADFAVESPKLTQCGQIDLKWAATKGPYNVVLVHPEDPCGDILHEFGDQQNNQVSWKVAYPAGTKLMVSVEDGNQEEGWSGALVVQPGSDDCLPKSSAAPAKSGSPSTLVVPKPTSASTPPPDAGSAAGAINAGGPLGTSGASSSRAATPVMAIAAIIAVAAFSL